MTIEEKTFRRNPSASIRTAQRGFSRCGNLTCYHRLKSGSRKSGRREEQGETGLAQRLFPLGNASPVKIREGLMKSMMLRRNLFVFALAASMLASLLAAAAPQQRPAPKPAAQQSPVTAPTGPITEAAPLVNKILPN